jgi:hypothetical protein
MNYGEPEIITSTPCPACGCREIFGDLARPGERERPTMLRCWPNSNSDTGGEFDVRRTFPSTPPPN